MIKTLKPLVLVENYSDKQLRAMIAGKDKHCKISLNVYSLFLKKCKQFDTTFLINDKGDIYTLAFYAENNTRLLQIHEQFYKSIMARAVLH